VVTVLVRDDNGVELRRVFAYGLYASERFAPAQTAIYQHTRLACDQQSRITGTATAQYANAHANKEVVMTGDAENRGAS
jgi:hypothetical protein